MGWGGDGKGWGGYGGGYGWGMPMMPPPFMMMKGKGKGGLRSFSNETKVWIGGLPANSTSTDLNKALKAHMDAAGRCLFAEIGKSGTGGAAFKTKEEQQKAIETLNGSNFQGNVIQVDVWTKKE
eukprot:TRINITY_DN82642_c0_g1_i1.p1 TRINITY_DN82642_c0_g1~~TRINITY_DN82642_c0_g1_i1.p1  ORF type:complete len:124 (+),score=43.21 TRINITY_DN82642_c0_g1_i1:63-434(+)